MSNQNPNNKIVTVNTSKNLHNLALSNKISLLDAPVSGGTIGALNGTLTFMVGGNKKTTYEFSSSNPLWRASLELIDFMPLTTVDYSGGIIITDWYSDSSNSNDSI